MSRAKNTEVSKIRRGPRTRGQSRRQGYTLVEVMMSVAVMTVGAMGIVALQQATVAGTRQGREVSTATRMTEKWLDRAREDALRWTVAGPPGVAATNYLSSAPAGAATPGTWFTPVPIMATRSFGADFFGEDTAVAADMVFCSNMRLNWVAGQNAIRVDVRTWWHKTGSSDSVSVDLQQFAGCGVGNENAVSNNLASATPILHAVYGSTVVRWNRP